MRFSFHESYAPGKDLGERLARIRAAGFEWVELDTKSVRQDRGRSAKRFLEAEGLRASALCGALTGSLLSDDRAVRQSAFDDLRALLETGGDLGAGGVVLAPLIGPPRLPDLSPWKSPGEVHRGLVTAYLERLAEAAEKAGCSIWLEPLNRYRTHFLQRLDDARSICEEIGSDYIGVMADTFHMALEETDPFGALQRAGKRLRHVHAVDTNRRLPGQGMLDFRPVLRTLTAIGFSGCLSFEAPVYGDFDSEVRAARALLESILETLIDPAG